MFGPSCIHSTGSENHPRKVEGEEMGRRGGRGGRSGGGGGGIPRQNSAAKDIHGEGEDNSATAGGRGEAACTAAGWAADTLRHAREGGGTGMEEKRGRKDGGIAIGVAATFTCSNSLRETFSFWQDKLGVLGSSISEAGYSQVLQELIAPSALQGTLASVVFINLKDWASDDEKSATSSHINDNVSANSNIDGSSSSSHAPMTNEEDAASSSSSSKNHGNGNSNESSDGKLADRVETMLRAAHGFASSGATRLLVLVVCPWRSEGCSSRQVELTAAEDAIVESCTGHKRMQVATSREIMRYFTGGREVGDGGGGMQEGFWDAVGDRLGHVPFTDGAAVAMVTCAVRIMYRELGPPVKAVVCDCDDTLWGGAVSEVGANGVRFEAQHLSLQQRLLDLRNQAGALICLCSRNESVDVVKRVFEERQSDMLLGWGDVTCVRVVQPSWGGASGKGEAVSDIALELNLGTESLVFVDDNPAECSAVRAHLPEACVVVAGGGGGNWLDTAWSLDVRGGGGGRGIEGKGGGGGEGGGSVRAEMYAVEGTRRLMSVGVSPGQDLAEAMGVQIIMRMIAEGEGDESVLERLAELTERTNQFNARKVVYTEGGIREYLREGGVCWSVDVSDRFGAYGVVGVVMARRIVAPAAEGGGNSTVNGGATAVGGVNGVAKGRSNVGVDVFALSCRALGRGVEHAMLSTVGKWAMVPGGQTAGDGKVTAKDETVTAEDETVTVTAEDGNVTAAGETGCGCLADGGEDVTAGGVSVTVAWEAAPRNGPVTAFLSWAKTVARRDCVKVKTVDKRRGEEEGKEGRGEGGGDKGEDEEEGEEEEGFVYDACKLSLLKHVPGSVASINGGEAGGGGAVAFAGSSSARVDEGLSKRTDEVMVKRADAVWEVSTSLSTHQEVLSGLAASRTRAGGGGNEGEEDEGMEEEEVRYHMRRPKKEREAMQVIREVWESVLGVRRARLNVPFAEYGGDSLSAVSVVSQAARRGVKLVFTPDFDMKSITELALSSVAGGNKTQQGRGGGKAIKEWDTRETYQKGGMKWFVGGISACAEGRLGDAISLWDQGRGWDPRYSADKYGSTPLMWASGGGHLDVARWLVQTGGVCAEAGNKEGRTALMWAAKNGHASVCRYLLEPVSEGGAGVDPSVQMKDGSRAFDWAIFGGSIEVMQLLEGNNRVDLHAQNHFGCGAAFWAAASGRVETCRWLLAKGIDFGLVNHAGHGAVHKAAWKGHEEALAWMIEDEEGPKLAYQLKMPAADGRDPIGKAKLNGHGKVSAWLARAREKHFPGWQPLPEGECVRAEGDAEAMADLLGTKAR